MKFVEDWKDWPRWWSTYFELAAASFFSYLAAAPDAVIRIWLSLPEDIRAAIDPEYIQWAGIALIASGSFCKIVEQQKLKRAAK